MNTKTLTKSLLALVAIAAITTAVHAKHTVEEYLREYPN